MKTYTRKRETVTAEPELHADGTPTGRVIVEGKVDGTDSRYLMTKADFTAQYEPVKPAETTTKAKPRAAAKKPVKS